MTEPAVIVDGVFFQMNASGIARVWYELLSRWQEMEIGRRILVLDRGRLPPFPKLRIIPCPAFDYATWEADRATLQEICDREGAGLFLSTYYTRAERTPSALLIYDMIPERLGFDAADPMWRQKHDSIRHAVAFGAISQNSLSDLREFFPETAAKPAIVARPGVNAFFSPPGLEERAQFHRNFIAPALEGRPFFLFVGDPAPYKNAALLFEALQKMPAEFLKHFALLLTHDELLAGFSQLPGLKVHASRLTDPGLRAAYGSAQALIYPSLYEGFGLPALEAMACGCPVIASNVSSLPEVVGDAALAIDPKDSSQLCQALIRMLDPQARGALRAKGLARAKLFSWDKMAEAWGGFVLETLAANAPIHQGTSP
jgi:glycosyltransferase involved in cell wall biosynthesis